MKKKLKGNVQIYGSGEGVNFKGKPMILKDDPTQYGIAFYDHTYLTRSFDNSIPSKHSCLQIGDWCWQNFFEHPLDLVSYIKRKLKK